ncbi:hypothetical protein [Sphingobacterium bovistauri]|uniref:Uncharacterized protein n=1 Tax=Sphingobacterium bovistauri TaxID=2781959 RepID=A0ABS7Z2X4_9SPHI|nr:hypothetical protein [Sphingobacterium bovistauri]MCA5004507.1 hypothetical protein [Sphingobacterium bovistauri]
MEISLKNTLRSIREICQGSSNISIQQILLRTFLILLAYLFISSKEVIVLLVGLKNSSTFKSEMDYLTFLENLRIDELTILVPIICTLTFIISSSVYYRRSSQLQMLPISPIEKIISYIVVIVGITIISLLFNYGLQYIIVYSLQKIYQPELIVMQEKIGELYKTISQDYILSTNYSIRVSPYSVLLISLVANLFILVSNLLFRKFGIIKGILLVISVAVVAALVHRTILMTAGTSIDINIAYDIVYFIYLPIMISCMILSFYFLLKEREG